MAGDGELREAAESLAALKPAECSRHGMVMAPIRLLDGAIVLARAWLREHPADDGEHDGDEWYDAYLCDRGRPGCDPHRGWVINGQWHCAAHYALVRVPESR